jgi:hypothetical protein
VTRITSARESPGAGSTSREADAATLANNVTRYEAHCDRTS